MGGRWAAVILLGASCTGSVEAGEKIQVDVYIQNDNWPRPLKYTQGLTSEIFERSDIHMIWHDGKLPASRDAARRFIGIRMMERAPDSLSPNAMASARPYGASGSLISVYEDRVHLALNGRPSLVNVLLSYIFAHELAHVILGYDYHSESGILKARWSNADYAAMGGSRLAFTAGDAQRIRDGLSVRTAAAK